MFWHFLAQIYHTLMKWARKRRHILSCVCLPYTVMNGALTATQFLMQFKGTVAFFLVTIVEFRSEESYIVWYQNAGRNLHFHINP